MQQAKRAVEDEIKSRALKFGKDSFMKARVFGKEMEEKTGKSSSRFFSPLVARGAAHYH